MVLFYYLLNSVSDALVGICSVADPLWGQVLLVTVCISDSSHIFHGGKENPEIVSFLLSHLYDVYLEDVPAVRCPTWEFLHTLMNMQQPTSLWMLHRLTIKLRLDIVYK